jgi:murein L,D-transpeptidase YafK
VTGGATIAERLEQYGPRARARIQPAFEQRNLPYPPAAVTLIGIKDVRQLEVWAGDDAGRFAHVLTYPVLAASGQSGPKLREGDRQVPEGLYEIESLNPNSRFHLALRVNYPNAFDRQQAQADGRTDLGGDIMIHGSNVSVGCLAMGDDAAEDLFVLVADTGREHTRVILTPTDFRRATPRPETQGLPAWTESLYEDLRAALAAFETE